MPDWEDLTPPGTLSEHGLRRKRGAFLAEIQALFTVGADPASEDTTRQLPRLITQHWEILSSGQSELSTWNMMLKAIETHARLKVLGKKGLESERMQSAFGAWLDDIKAELQAPTALPPGDEDDDEEEDE